MKLWKGIFICALAVVMALLCVLSMPQTAHAASESDLNFGLNDTRDGCVVYGCDTSASGDLVIPETFEGLPVTAIASYAFFGCKNLTSITIPNSVTQIGWQAFDGCSALTSINIPASVISIDGHAFNGCTSLSYNTHNNIKYLGNDSNPHMVLIGVTTNQMSNYEIHPETKIVCSFAFEDCTKMTNITIPDQVIFVDSPAFYHCDNLTQLTVAEGNTVYHSAGNSIIETDTKTLIAGCKTSQIPRDGSVICIGDHAFYYVSGLTDIVIPDSVTVIGSNVFDGCVDLTSITIPKNVTDISSFAFGYTPNLASLQVEEGNPVYYSAGNCIIEIASKTLIRGCHTSRIPSDESVTVIGDAAFGSCYGLTSIVIPDNITTIGYDAFGGCRDLTSVTIGNSVTTIGDMAFLGCSSLTSISFPNSVRSIGGWAFQSCTNLTSVTIADGVTDIGSHAFSLCPNLISINLPSGITTISEGMLWGTGLATITIPDSVTTISRVAFAECPNLTSISIPYSVTTIGEKAFQSCPALTSITIPSKMTSISNYLFQNCNNLTDITLPESVGAIGYAAFDGCNSLATITYYGTESQWKAVEISNENQAVYNATVIFSSCEHNWIDADCDDPKTCVICGKTEGKANGHNYVNGICVVCDYCSYKSARFELNETGASYIVTDCSWSAIGELVIPSTYNGLPVTCIADYAFSDCNKLTSITIPDSITSIGILAFSSCENLTSLQVSEGNPVYHSAGNCIIETNSKTLIAGCNTSQIPADGSVSGIGIFAFHGYDRITSITIPEGTTWIGEDAFSYCFGMTSIVIPNSVNYISEQAFYECTGLTSVTYCGTQEQWDAIGVGEYNDPLLNATLQFHNFENGSCTICGHAEENWNNVLTFELNDTGDGYILSSCKMSATGELVIPSVYNGLPVICVGDIAFMDCTDLTSVVIPDSVISIGDAVFNGCTGLTSVTLSSKITKIKSNAFAYCSSLSSITIPNGVTDIEFNAFIGCTSLTNVVIPDSVTSIGYQVFKNCTGLTSILLGNGIVSIGASAFECCSSLTNIAIPNSVVSIGDSAFGWCSSLTSITIPDGVTSIGNWVFSYCGNLIDVTLSESITTIGMSAFSNCSSLAEISFPEGVTSIGGWAFQSCSSLTSATIPQSVTNIGDWAFSLCPNLTNINIPSNLTTISEGMLWGSGLATITIPDSVIAIARGAFAECLNLTEITIPNGVVTIGEKAFKTCESLSSIIIPGSIANIGANAFVGCTSLDKAIYCGTQEQWDTIEKAAGNDSLLNATLQFHNFETGICTLCGEIGTVASGTCGENVTWELFGDGTLIIEGSGKMEDYYFHFMDSNIAEPPPWYSYCALIKNVSIQSGVTSIGAYAFYACSNLESITIPASIESVGICVFTGCKKLLAVYIMNLTAWCNIDFEYYYYPEGPAGPSGHPLKWGGKLYLNGEEVKDLVIPDGITTIKYCAFYFGSFNSITIPSSVHTIDNLAFYDCYAKSIVIPNSVTKIVAGAFGNCGGLKNVTYCGTQTQWNAIEIGSSNDPLLSATLQLHSFENGVCGICGQKELAVGDIDGNDEVTYEDAVYLLLYSMFGEELYPLSGADGDIDGNGTVDQDDAVYLLLHSLFGDMFYPLKNPALPAKEENAVT